VHGFDFQYLPVDEAHPYGAKLNYYHETKMRAEEVVLRSGLPAVTVRPGWIYGPNDDNGGVTQMLIKIARHHFAIVGSGSNRLHPVYIDDVVDGIVAAAASERYGEAFLLLGPEVTTLRGFVNSMSEALRVDRVRWRVPYAAALLASYALEPAWHIKNRTIGPDVLGDKPPITRDSLDVVARDQVFDTSRAEAAFGHTPRVDIRDGLERTVSWLSESRRLPSEVAGRIERSAAAGRV
jgi:nucleoside-diphosphate-sugar epimerase